jgi:hypothetical protein
MYLKLKAGATGAQIQVVDNVTKSNLPNLFLLIFFTCKKRIITIVIVQLVVSGAK